MLSHQQNLEIMINSCTDNRLVLSESDLEKLRKLPESEAAHIAASLEKNRGYPYRTLSGEVKFMITIPKLKNS